MNEFTLAGAVVYALNSVGGSLAKRAHEYARETGKDCRREMAFRE